MSQFSNNLIVSLLVALFVFLGAPLIFAQEDPFAQLTFPIPELGNCASMAECEIFCEQPQNAEACLNYALEHNLIPEEEKEMARKMLELGEIGGPGGCQGRAECEAYCNQIANMEECINFAIEHDMMPPEELEEAKKVLAAIQQGITPPACGGKVECDIYCSQPEHMEECMEFAIAAGIMPPGEIEEAQKMLQAIEAGVVPPNCHGKAECDIYCRQPEHMEECMEFAIAAGFAPPEEVENMKKTLEAIKAGINPPDCYSDQECQIYCAQPEHMEECMEFAIAAGFMPPEEIENAKKMLNAMKQGIAPPPCHSEEECEVYCSKPENVDQCVDFSVAAGFMPAEDAEQAKKMIKLGITGGPGGCQSEEECEAFCQDPANFETCIDFSVLIGEMTPEEAEQAKQMKGESMIGGPGGCQTKEECTAYCQDPANFEECLWLSVKMGEMLPEEAEEMIRQKKMMEQPYYEEKPYEEMMGPEEIMPYPDQMQQIEEEIMQEIIEEKTEEIMEQIEIPQMEMPQEELLQESPQTRSGWQPFLAAIISIFLR